ncbi:hypothetical protein ACU686_35785 [Yinghuangia aomiensis]
MRGRGRPSRTSADPDAAIEGHQVHGQDIPWLLRHWADNRPEHPALVWEPGGGAEGRTWTYADLLTDTHRAWPPAWSRAASAAATRCLVHADNCARHGHRMARLRDRRRGGGDHEHPRDAQ